MSTDEPRLSTEKAEVSHHESLPESHPVVINEDGPELHFKVTPRLVLSVLALMLGYNGSFFSLSLVGPIISIINKEVGPEPYYAWMSIAWSMACAIMVTVAGRLMDIFGRRYLMILGNAICVIGCIVAGTAHSVGVIICGLAILGAGTGFQLQATAAIAELVPKRLRPIVTGIVAFSLFVPGVFGTPIAYRLVKTSWRWSFWVTMIIDALTCICLILVYFPPTFEQKHVQNHRTKWQELADFDFVGLLLFIGSLVSLLLGINWGGSTHPWASATVIVPIAIGGLGLIAFFLYEALMPLRAALIPKVLLRDLRGFVAVISTIFVAGMLLYSLQILWPQMCAVVYGADDTRIGWLGCTFAGGTVVGALSLALVIAKLGHGRLVLVTVVASQTAVVGAMAAMNQHTLAGSVVLTTLAGLCVGCIQLVSITMIILRCPDQFIGVAVGLAGTARLVGGAIATAIYTTVLSNKVAQVLPANVAQAALVLDFPQQDLGTLIAALLSDSPSALTQVPGATPAVIEAASAAVTNSYVQGFRLIFLITIAFGGTATLAACCTKNFDDQLTDHVAAELNHAHVRHDEDAHQLEKERALEGE
ncbi:MAG: hypothetical protein M1818_002723 [Claussenomyces sp. TS43310]|nr:MAG: hypothetical protein M1818_002723 [Claussenomyces sp. TS43310]